MKQPKAVWKKSFSEEIQSAVVNDSYVGLVLKEGETESRLYLYGQDRERKLAINVDSSYDHVEMSDDEVLFYSPLILFLPIFRLFCQIKLLLHFSGFYQP